MVLSVGLVDHSNNGDFMKIVALACFCTVHNHGFEMLFSFSAVLQHTPLPFGFSIINAGLKKSVLLSVYTSKMGLIKQDSSSHGLTCDGNNLPLASAVDCILELSMLACNTLNKLKKTRKQLKNSETLMELIIRRVRE